MRQLVDQPTALPTRKLGSASAVSAVVAGIAGAITGILPGDPDMVRDALTVILDALVSGFLGGIIPLLGGYFVRDKDAPR